MSTASRMRDRVAIVLAALLGPSGAMAQECLGYAVGDRFAASIEVMELNAPRVVRPRVAYVASPRVVIAGEVAYDVGRADRDDILDDSGGYGGGIALIYRGPSREPALCTFAGIRIARADRDVRVQDHFSGDRIERFSHDGTAAFAGLGIGQRMGGAEGWEITPYTTGAVSAFRTALGYKCVSGCPPDYTSSRATGEIHLHAELEGGLLVQRGRVFGASGVTYAFGDRELLRPSPRMYSASTLILSARLGFRL